MESGFDGPKEQNRRVSRGNFESAQNEELQPQNLPVPNAQGHSKPQKREGVDNVTRKPVFGDPTKTVKKKGIQKHPRFVPK